jgi:diguanylate cyclase (GGDEF)-like protein/PAS domain S-box-containing protein
MPIDIQNDSLVTAMKKLKAREDVLRELEKVSGLGSWEVDLKQNKSFWSKRSYEIYGIPEETPVNLNTFLDRLDDKNRLLAQKTLQQALQNGGVVSLQLDTKKEDGTPITILVRGEVIFDADNKPHKIIGTTQDITEIVKIKKEAKELAELLEHSSNEIYIVDIETLRYLYVNQGACNALGYTKEELLSMNIRDINPHLTNNEIMRIRNILHTSKHVLNKSVHQRKDGSYYHVQSYIHTLKYKNKDSFVIFDIDITATIELERQHNKQAKILEHIHDSVIATDIYGKIKTWNEGSHKLFGYSVDEAVDMNIQKLYAPQNEYSLDELFNTLNEKQKLNAEIYMLKKDGTSLICDISLSLLRDHLNQIEGYIGYIQDITEKKATEQLLKEQTQLLRYQAHHDMLTNLPNRTLFKERLERSIIESKRHQKNFALFFLDLDQFKKINDSLGHHIGDEVLIEVAKRLQSSLREEDTLSRLGGDEFTVILKDIKNPKNAATVAQKILNNLKEPIKVEQHLLHISASIGIALYPDDATDIDNLIKYADVAMYKAKDEGRNNFQFYSHEMTKEALERVVLENSLRTAIEEKEFHVYYQPQYDARTEKIVGMEALVRWIHPHFGTVSPAEFIPLAEENGLIIDIDRIVMKKAMQQFSQWYKEGLHPGVLALNLSMRQLSDNHFITHLLQTMQETDFDSSWLELEVTEGQMMSNPEHSIKKLKRLSEMGIEIAIDDFGTGYSSLSYLKKLPLNKLKIDQSFVRDIPDDDEDVAITKAIIALGESLNLRLIAEGVETKEQKEFLLQNNCHFIQGYYYSKPIPAKEITELLALQT